MTEPTLEDVVKRLETIEKELAEQRAGRPPEPAKDWRSVVGLFDDDPEFMQQVIAEGQAIREAERLEARAEKPE